MTNFLKFVIPQSMKRLIYFIFLLSFLNRVEAAVIPKTYRAISTSLAIKIDGKGNDEAWKAAEVAGNFKQLDPVQGNDPSQQTEVRLVYDNTALYIFARMYDAHPDSILHELGNRDEGSELNSDAFRFGCDPYNKRQNGYVFEVTASGVQSESFSDDITFDAVWQSAVSFDSLGWCVEMKIPYSAIRFPAGNIQTWGMQFARVIRRNREYDQWTLTPKETQNKMLYWGTMTGIENIHPPLRLNLTPYFSIYGIRSPRYVNGSISGSDRTIGYSGGADIKYGIDERFTLDMTLLPDFSQVQSDNKIKNLSAFETIYSENRPFFKEGTSLFNQGGIFYSRRIGKTPSLFYDVPYMLEEGEEIESNPDKARLLNATKISGRTDKGLGIGLINAITANTYAVIKKADGSLRKILTEPLTNYNVLLLDQQFKHNSNLIVENANTIRNGKGRDANVTALQSRIEDKNNTMRFSFGSTITHVSSWTEVKNTKDGGKLFAGFDKIKGPSQYGIFFEAANKNYDKNDLGYSFYKDYSILNLYYSLNAFNPFWKYFKQGSITPYYNRNGIPSLQNRSTNEYAGFNFFVLTNNNWSAYCDFGTALTAQHDYYEPRIEGRYVVIPKNYNGSVNFTSNYNKRLAFDFGSRFNIINEWNNKSYGYYINPVFRVSDKMKIRFEHYLDVSTNDRGFSDYDDQTNDVYFGRRDIITITNALTGRYLIKNDMSITLTGRHYWSEGTYNAKFLLTSVGNLEYHPASNSTISNSNFNSNYFTVDLVYNWQFAPGSSFLATYKNVIFSDDASTQFDYFSNLNRTFTSPQTNSIYLKFLYYLDYQYLVKKKS